MKDADDVMPNAAIEKALEAIRRRIDEAECRRVALVERIAADREEEQLLARILAVRRGEIMKKPPALSSAPSIQESSNPPIAGNPVEAVVHELTSAGRPVHISDLMRLLASRKVPIPGAGTQANLITYLRRDPRFIRASRGMYALAEWGIDAMPPTRSRKRRKRGRARVNE